MTEIDLNKAEEKFSSFLKSKGLKSTLERLIILKEACATEGHFEADDLLVILKQKGRKSSRATIYRTLEILAQSGILRKVWLGGTAIQFEIVKDGPVHNHLVCQNCGQKIEYYLPELEEIKAQISQRFGFAIKDCNFQIFGLCANCSKQE